MNKTFYIGIVENRNDPLELGRVQVRVFGVHSESLDDIPVQSLPWAISVMPATSASISGIGNSVPGYVEGTMVFVFFLDGESKQQPVIIGSAAGLPQSKSVFGDNGVLEIEVFKPASLQDPETGAAAPLATPVVTSDGTVVTDGSGEPVVTETPPEPDPSKLNLSNAIAKYGSNVSKVYEELLNFGIKDDNACIAILSNVGKECKFVPVREGMSYSSVERIRKIFPSKTKTLTDEVLQKKYVSNAENLANLVYSNSDGNGDEASGDGFKYRGGGFIQLTKKNNYAAVGKKIGVDLIAKPESVIDSAIASKVVAQYFINRFGGSKKLAFDDLETALTTVTRAVNPGGFNNDIPKVRADSKLYTTNKTPLEEKKEKEKKETVAPNDPKNDLDKKATQTQIDMGITSNVTTTSNLGFKDPSGKFPLTALLKEQDTNRLARRSTYGTSVETKLKNRRTEIKSGTGSFSEPLPAYNATYPHNHIYASESGHVMEFDDTPNSERVNIFHKSGTFTEIDAIGNVTNKIVGDNFSITERNGYVYIDGTARITVGSSVKLTVGGDLDISVDGNLNYDVGGNVTMKIGGALNGKAGSGISLRSDGKIDLDGSKLMLNSNTSKQVDVSARSGVYVDHANNAPTTFVGEASIKIEDMGEDVAATYIEKEIKKGNITKKEVEDGANAKVEKTDETTAPAPVANVVVSCEQFSGKTEIPDSTQVSKNYTIGMLSSKAAASSYKIVAQRGLNIAEIACNLKQVAVNCLELIKAQYPKMLVTSGFRKGNGTSQHELGQAIDMQFGVSNSDYYDIAVWIKNNVPFDQLLLEYKTIESGRAWIHISYASSLRGQVFTFMNHKNNGSGLRKLQ